MLTIDGSTLEGGGQLTRLALSLSAITGIPVRIHSIRAGRAAKRRGGHGSAATAAPSHSQKGKDRGRDQDKSKGKGSRGQASTRDGGDGKKNAAGGLHHSHLAALEFLAEQCNAKVKGAYVGSTEVVFRPGKVNPLFTDSSWTGKGMNRDFTIALETSGSVWLIFQAVFPFIVFGMDWSRPPAAARKPQLEDTGRENEDRIQEEDDDDDTVTLTLRGGTNVSSAMSTEYMTEIFCPMAERIGLPRVEIETVRRGWAGPAPEVGEVKITIHRPKNRAVVFSTPSPSDDTAKPTPTPPLPASSPRPSFSLGSFTIPPPTLPPSHISITLLCPAPFTAPLTSTLQSQLSTSFPSIPILSPPRVSSTSTPRHLSIHLTAHLPRDVRIGATHLSTGRLPRTPAETHALLTHTAAAAVSLLSDQFVRLQRSGSGACVDQHLEDQLVVFQALAAGVSRVRYARGHVEDVDEDGCVVEMPTGGIEGEGGDRSGTMHARTARWVCKQVLGCEMKGPGCMQGVGWDAGDERRRRGRGREEEDLGLGGLNVHDDDDDDDDGYE